MFYLETNKKDECCCRECEQICPTKCIDRIEDEEGVRYPIKSKKLCIDCHLCKKACPNINKKNSIK